MPGRQKLTIQMNSGGCSMSGRLTSRADGKPVAGVSLSSWCVNRQSYSGTTDAGGRFDIFGLEPDTYRLRIQEGSPWVIEDSPEIAVPEGQTVTVELQAVRGAFVSGHVLDEKTGEPMPRLQMRFDSPDGVGFGTGTYPQTFTDDQGAYTIGPLTPGRYRVIIWGDFITETSYTLASFDDVTGLDFKAAHDAAVTGTVVDSESRPVAGASVVAASAETQHFAMTDSDGRFSIRLAKRNLPARLQAYSLGRASEEVGPVRGDSEHRLTLQAASRIEGTVVDQSGRPQSDMLVQVEPSGPLWYPGNGSDATNLIAAITSAMGGFRLNLSCPASAP
jgi:protocatechuate 3,4-dioxygenase beta subunit